MQEDGGRVQSGDLCLHMRPPINAMRACTFEEGRLTIPEVRRVLALAVSSADQKVEVRCRRSSRSSDGVPCDVLKPVVLSVVEDVTEPLVRVEREHGDVRVRMSEGGDVGGERGVVVDDVLLVERDVGRADMSWRPFERRHVEKKVRSAEVVGVCVLLPG